MDHKAGYCGRTAHTSDTVRIHKGLTNRLHHAKGTHVADMTIADTLMRTSSVTLNNGSELPIDHRHRGTVKSAKRVRIDQLANDVWLGWTQAVKPPHLDSMRVRLPFDALWVEWVVDQPTAAALFGGTLDVHSIGVLCQTTTLEEMEGVNPFASSEGAELFVTLEAFFKRSPGYGEVAMVATAEIALTADGVILAQKIVKQPGEQEDVARRLNNIFHSPVLMAIALMNCQNVATEPVPPVKRPRKSKPERIPRLEFHTIKLPSRRGTSVSDSATSTDKHERAHHLVRGHFKTYTADAPLMGRVVGTYWWGWQARGRKKNGIVVSEYEVAR